MTVDEILALRGVAVVAADDQGLITRVNGDFERLFGWRASEAVGRPVTLIIPRGLRDAHNLGFSAFLASGRPVVSGHPVRLRAVDKSGREFDAEHLIAAERVAGRWRFAAAIRELG